MDLKKKLKTLEISRQLKDIKNLKMNIGTKISKQSLKNKIGLTQKDKLEDS